MSRTLAAQLNMIPFCSTKGECLGPVGLAVLHGLKVPVAGIKGDLRVDRIRVPKNFRGRAHKHPTDGINIVLQGRARHYFGPNLEFRDVGQGDIFFVPANEPHLVCSLEGCVAVEVGLGGESTTFCPELDKLWAETRASEWDDIVRDGKLTT